LVGWGVPCIAVLITASFHQYGLTQPINGAYVSSRISRILFLTGVTFAIRCSFSDCSSCQDLYSFASMLFYSSLWHLKSMELCRKHLKPSSEKTVKSSEC